MTAQPSRRRLVPEDLYRFVLCEDPQISPDGEWVAFVRSAVEGEDREYRSEIWLVRADGAEPPRRFTAGPVRDAQPRWSPDGRRLAFVRTIGKGQEADRQIWIIDRDGGEAWQLTTMRYGAGDPVWSPDGRYLAFTAEVDPAEPPEAAVQPRTPEDRKAEERRAKDQARVFTRIRYKFDLTGLHSGRYRQVWVVAVPPGPEGERPRPVPVTGGEFDHSHPAWSPDGTLIAVEAMREPEREHLRVHDIWVFPVPGTGAKLSAPVKVTASDGIFFSPAFSPDGRWIAAVGHKNEYTTATLPRVWLFPAPGQPGSPVCLTAGWDQGVGDTVGSDLRGSVTGGLHWSPDGQYVYFHASDRGATHLFRVRTETGAVERLVAGSRDIYGFTLDRGCRRAALAVAEMENPGDIYLYDLEAGAERRLTDLNAALRAEIEWPEVEELHFTARDGQPLHGWIMKPVGWRPGERYPLVLEIHGGPHTCYGHAFYQEFQVLAAAGYGVLFINPRGSTSYGQEFARACQGDYGGRDYQDLMDAVDHALTLGWVDPARLGVTGGSYGGFMTNWIIGHTDRFAAAVTHRSISNWISFWGVSDIGPWFSQGEHQVEELALWKDLETLWDRSPLKYAPAIRTPLLICHSEHDLRCPMEQAEQLYLALKMLGREVELVRHPRSNHELTRSGPPVLRVDRFHHILRWFRKYMPPGPAAGEPGETAAPATGA
ncbi:MAG: S9 family peptidase [Firmicutes bacterium]|nr:S9 family peptidase [Bacillota bacterium]